ncbi:MAG: hypothetical protein K2R98_33065 [Gemmataceae bacterium]|nr:hypothetical protein [Gemmataceae bacterium]
MNGFRDLNIIRLFDFYLALMFLISLYRRFGQYRAIGGIAFAVPGRWPNLLNLIRSHGSVFLTWSTFLPALVALILTIIQIALSRWLFPNARLTPEDVADLWVAWPALLILSVAMVGFDMWGVVDVSPVNQTDVEKYFDQAEFWLRSWTAPIVHALTFGRINPRQMVHAEVQKALVEASHLLNSNLWWIAIQVALRMAFGLALWLTFALEHSR